MIPIIMPQVGQDIPSAKVVQWLKQENEPVEKGEVIVVVESEKAAFEVEAEASGVLLKILHQEDEDVEIFEPLAYIGEPGEQVPDDATATKTSAGAKQSAPKAEAAPGAPAAPAEKKSDRLIASPAARRVAKERGIDLRNVQPTGPRGRILERDVLAAVSEAAGDASVAAGDQTVVFGKARKELARRLTLSKQTIPHFYLCIDVDMTAVSEWRKTHNSETRSRITTSDLLIKSSAAALREFPRMNAHVKEDRTILKGGVHIGVAVSVDDGLLVPAISDADKKSLQEISEISKKNADAARRGVLPPGPAGTFTISSLGMYGIRMFLPVINPPECAILAAGSLEPRVVPAGGEIAIRQMMTLTLACDHRAVDGAYGAQFLQRIKERLETVAVATEERSDPNTDG